MRLTIISGKNAQYHGTKSRITCAPDIRDVFEKKESILKVSKKDAAFNVNILSTKKKSNV